MSIMIDKQKCKGCGLCTEVCPGSLIYQGDDKKHTSGTRKIAGAALPVSKNVTLVQLDFFLAQTSVEEEAL